MMVAWGFNKWAMEAISTKYGVTFTEGFNNAYVMQIPEHFHGPSFIQKLQRLYGLIVLAGR